VVGTASPAASAGRMFTNDMRVSALSILQPPPIFIFSRSSRACVGRGVRIGIQEAY
jgi:hypothetical protein